jgi:hypothetical protein
VLVCLQFPRILIKLQLGGVRTLILEPVKRVFTPKTTRDLHLAPGLMPLTSNRTDYHSFDAGSEVKVCLAWKEQEDASPLTHLGDEDPNSTKLFLTPVILLLPNAAMTDPPGNIWYLGYPYQVSKLGTLHFSV